MVGPSGGDDRPDTCPKCDRPLNRPDPLTIDAALRRHFEGAHRDAIGIATSAYRDPIRFGYLRPVTQTSEPWWWVLLLDGPALVTKLRPRAWNIEWERPRS